LVWTGCYQKAGPGNQKGGQHSLGKGDDARTLSLNPIVFPFPFFSSSSAEAATPIRNSLALFRFICDKIFQSWSKKSTGIFYE
jgi:hypothetical protein